MSFAEQEKLETKLREALLSAQRVENPDCYQINLQQGSKDEKDYFDQQLIKTSESFTDSDPNEKYVDQTGYNVQYFLSEESYQKLSEQKIGKSMDNS